MAAKLKSRLTPEEYLAIEREAPEKSEFYDGRMHLMARVNEAHSLIVVNVGGALHQQLRSGPCRTYLSQMRVRVSETGLYTYPDAIVVCEPPQFKDERRDTLLNPTLLVEVLSPSTESYDRGKKSEQYRRLASLQEYLLIAQDRPHVESYRRHEGGQWLLTEASGLEATIRLVSIDGELALSEVYAQVEFQAEETT